MTQTAHNSNLWKEPADNGGMPSTFGVRLQLAGPGIFAPATSGAADGVHIDIDNDGIYKPVDLTDRLYYIDVAGVPTLSTTGDEAYLLVDDGTGVLTLTTDLTQTPAAAMYFDGTRYITTAPDGADGLQLLAIGSSILPYR